jgi:hypothetical protein
MANVLGRVRSHIPRISKESLSSTVFRYRNRFQRVSNALILSASSSNVTERIERKREEALLGGGLKRIGRQHKRVLYSLQSLILGILSAFNNCYNRFSN